MSKPKLGYTIQTGINKIIELLTGDAPEVPTEDGEYVFKVTISDGEATYEWSEDVGDVPEAPTEDGEYVLKVTISDGEATYEWSEDEGGGSIPATREDIGKYLGVKESETETETATVIPQQTATFDEEFAVLNNCDVQFFMNASVGDTITAVIDETEMTLTATDMDGAILFINGNHAVGVGGPNVVLYGYLGDDPPESVTISATTEVPLPETDWLAVPGPLVVNVDGSLSDATYNTVKEAINRGASVRFIYSDEVSGYMYCGIALSYEYDSEAVERPYKVHVIRPESDAQLGTIALVLDTFDSTNADTNNLSLR